MFYVIVYIAGFEMILREDYIKSRDEVEGLSYNLPKISFQTPRY